MRVRESQVDAPTHRREERRAAAQNHRMHELANLVDEAQAEAFGREHGAADLEATVGLLAEPSDLGCRTERGRRTEGGPPRHARHRQLADNPRVRGLSGLLTAVMALFVLVTAPAAAAGGHVPAPQSGPATAVPAAALPGTNPRSPSGADAVAPPGTGDVDRHHEDPGAWPGLIFIFALFTLALVRRGRRARRRPPGRARRRRR